jgi:hypothetical protein
MLASTGVIAFAHSSARTVIDAPNKVGMLAKPGGDVRWILPGLRELDPAVFGTPDNPLRAELLPLTMRTVLDDGTYVAAKPDPDFPDDPAKSTPMPTPFSNNRAPITGTARVKVIDVTSVAGSSTLDKIDAVFEFTSPPDKNGEVHQYKLVVTQALPKIPDHENFGGVGINALQHGATGIGTPLMPQVMSFIAFWGAADLYVDGELQDGKRFVHFMLSERVRDADYNLVFNAGVDPEGPLQAHLILPPVAVTEDGPVGSGVPTSFILPNGVEQPFLHIMYETVTLNR